MGLGDRRDRRRQEREEFGARGSAKLYQMRQEMVSFGDDFWIEDADGERVLRVDGKALRMRKTLDMEDLNGEALCRIQSRVLRVRDTMAIERPDGSTMATVHQALVNPLRERWKVEVPDGEDLVVQGNIVDHEYEIEMDDHKVAEVSKKWFRVRDTYGVEIAPGADTLLVLAVAVAVDMMSHPKD